MLDVSDEVRAEIGDDEADRLLGGVHAPDTYDCTACRNSGNPLHEPTSTVLFVGEETAVLAFAHARCIPSQVVPVSEEQLLGAVRSISQAQGSVLPPQAGLPDLGRPAAAGAGREYAEQGYDALGLPITPPAGPGGGAAAPVPSPPAPRAA
ncbi:hypothetical protein ACQRUO_08155, partial [Kitasatospora sp. LaBMicrA B282]